jgi:beta-N-acetylhexosaminidase
MVKCYINAYNDDEITITKTIDKIMGESEFKGTPNELVWCEKWQTRL